LALNYYVLLLVRILEGVGSAFYVTSSVAVLAVASPPEKRGTFMSIFTGALLLGAVVGPIAGGLAAEAGLRWPFFLYAILAAIGLVLQFFLLPEGEFSAPKGPPSPVDRKVRFMTASFVLVNLGVMSAFFLRGALNTIYPLYATERFDFRTSTIGLLFTVTALASMVTLFPAGRWADRSGRKAPFVLSLLLSSAFTPLFVVAWDLPGQMLAMVAYGLASGLTGPMAAWAVDLTPRERLGPAMGVFRLVGDLGWLGGPLLAGWAAEVAGRTSPWPFILPALFGVVVGAALLLADDPAARRKPAEPLPGPSTAPISEDPGGH
jgi:MFS family permease